MEKEQKVNLPLWLPHGVKYFLTQQISNLSIEIFPRGVTKETRTKDLLEFLENVKQVIIQMAAVSEMDCAMIIRDGWQYSYSWDNDRMQKYKTKDVIKQLRRVRNKLVKFRDMSFPRVHRNNQGSMVAAHVSTELATSLNKVFKKYLAKENTSDFAKILIATPEILDDCNHLPRLPHVLDLLCEHIQDEINNLNNEPYEFDQLLDGRINRKNSNDAKAVSLTKILGKKLLESFALQKDQHTKWLAEIVGALVNDKEVSVTKDNIRKNLKPRGRKIIAKK